MKREGRNKTHSRDGFEGGRFRSLSVRYKDAVKCLAEREKDYCWAQSCLQSKSRGRAFKALRPERRGGECSEEGLKC